MSESNLFTRKSIQKLLIPLIFEQLMIVLVGLFDTMLLSGISESALAAFSLVDSINQLLTQLFLAIGAGGSIIAAQYIGNRDRKGAENTATQSAMMVVIISVSLALPVVFLRSPLLRLLYPKINDSIRGYAQQYLMLSALSYPFLALYNSGISMLYAQGYSKMSMITSVIMNTVKILLNFLLIKVIPLDVTGAGLATIISRFAGAVIVTYMLMNQHAPIHYTMPLKLRLLPDTNKRILQVALPSGLENIIFLACKLVVGIMIAGYSGAMIAANAATNTISTYLSVPANAFNLATITIVSQCIGAGHYKEAKRVSKLLQAATYASFVLTGALVAVFIDPLIHMLNLSGDAFMHTRKMVLIYCVVAALLWTPSFSLPNSLRAAGDNKFVMYAAVFSVVVFRLVGGYVLGDLINLQVHGIWYAMYLDWLVRSVLFMWRFRSDKWLKHRLV